MVFLIHTELRCTVNHTSDLQEFLYYLLPRSWDPFIYMLILHSSTNFKAEIDSCYKREYWWSTHLKLNAQEKKKNLFTNSSAWEYIKQGHYNLVMEKPNITDPTKSSLCKDRICVNQFTRCCHLISVKTRAKVKLLRVIFCGHKSKEWLGFVVDRQKGTLE